MKNKIIIIISSVVVTISIIALVCLYLNGNIFESNKSTSNNDEYTEATVPVIQYDDIKDWHDAWIGMERIEEYVPIDSLPEIIQSLIVSEPSRGIPLACIYIGLGFTEEDSVEYVDRTPTDSNIEVGVNGWLIDGEYYTPSYWIVNGEGLLVLQNHNDESKVMYKQCELEVNE